MEIRDIKIIGAGPGGLITGLKLLEAGFEPTIIEKQEGIHTTLCGEGLSADTLSRVPFRDWSEYAPQKFDKATFLFPGGYSAYVNKECYTMDRVSWFSAMAKEFEKRGGTLELGRKIDNVKDLEYDLLIGADGPLSVVARHVGNKMQHIPGVQCRIKHDYEFDGMEFHLDKRYSEEYAWIFAKGDVFNVGVLGSMKQLDAFMKDKGLDDGELVDRLGYNVPFFGTKIQEGNIILTGDAAGITNPLTKGGMAAIVNVADIIVKCLKEEKINEYQQRVFSHPVMAPEYKLALKYFMELDNKKLEMAGKMINGKDLGNLDKRTRLKLGLAAAIIAPHKLKVLMKATRYAHEYSW
ncbi:MAG: NAD(P)/FAD-dependent oxidoreductase [Candidatus Aenigmatarchaeota archaeon]